MRPLINLRGQKFGRITFMRRSSSNKNKWLAICDCGTRWEVEPSHVKAGRVKGCGCVNKICRTTHGFSKHPLYHTWLGVMDRCYNKGSFPYERYGGRGIYVCDRWKSMANFISDLSPRPEGASLDRIDNDGPYSPENCRWATPLQQANNKRTNRFLTFKGVTKSLSEWARIIGVKRSTLNARLNDYGWSVEKTLTTKTNGGLLWLMSQER